MKATRLLVVPLAVSGAVLMAGPAAALPPVHDPVKIKIMIPGDCDPSGCKCVKQQVAGQEVTVICHDTGDAMLVAE